jgi:hypothetical protein
MKIPKGHQFMKPLSSRSGFSIAQILISVAIVVVLAIAVAYLLSPSQLLKQSRDASRVSSLSALDKAIGFYYSDAINNPTTLFLGTSSVMYISIPDPSATSTAGDQCQGIPGLPTLANGWTYHCVTNTYLKNTDGTGWMPVNLKSNSAGTLIANLPVDPTNTTTSGLWYSYTASNNTYELSAAIESKKYGFGGTNDVISGDGGTSTSTYVKGSDLALMGNGTGSSSSSLIAWWKFDEGSGTMISDSAGTSNGTAYSSDYSWVTGHIGPYAGHLANNDGYVGVGSSSVLALTGNMTISAWAQFSGSQQNEVFVWRGSGNYNYFLGIPSGASNKVAFCIHVSGGNACAQSSSTYNDGTWHLYSGVFNGSNVLLYVDGSLAVTGSSTAGPIIDPSSNSLYLGANDTADDNLVGSIDDVRIYNSALTATQVQNIYNGN